MRKIKILEETVNMKTSNNKYNNNRNLKAKIIGKIKISNKWTITKINRMYNLKICHKSKLKKVVKDMNRMRVKGIKLLYRIIKINIHIREIIKLQVAIKVRYNAYHPI